MKLRAIEKFFLRSPLRVRSQRKSEAPRLLSNLGIKEESICLEIGSGHGAGSLLINRYLKCHRLVGIDIDPDMVKAARKYISRPPGWAKGIRTDNIEFIVGDATWLAFPDNYFDAAVHFAVLDHIREWRRVISEVFRVLKPEGIYSFEDVLLPESRFLLNRYFGHVSIKEYELQVALEEKGFIILSFEKKRRSRTCFVRAIKPAERG